MNCPICDKEIEDLIHNELEDQGRCKDDYHFYFFENFNGSREETFNNVSIFASNLQSREEQSELRFQRKAIIQLARNFYLRAKERGEQ